MNPPAMRLGGWHQAYLYGVGASLILSGLLWLLFHYFVRISGEFGATPHPLEPWWLRVHGLSAAAFLIGLGSVLPGHVRRAWQTRRNRVSGGVFFSVMLTLVVSGYTLYYTGSEIARAIISSVHWVVGLGLPLLTGWHVWRGRTWRRKKADLPARQTVSQPAEIARPADLHAVR